MAFGVLVLTAIAALPIVALPYRIVCGAMAVAGLVLVRGAGMTYECDEHELRARRFWGRVERYPLSALTSVSAVGPLSVRVKFEGVGTLHFDPTRPDQQALAEHLRAKVHGARPALSPSGGGDLVTLRALDGLPADRCTVCGSDDAVAPLLVHAHHGYNFFFASFKVWRGFPLPVCRFHRWLRRLAGALAWLLPLALFALGLALAITAVDASRRGLLIATFVATPVLLLLLANDVARYVLDVRILGVRLGWLSADTESSRIVFANPTVEARIRAHLDGWKGAPESGAAGGTTKRRRRRLRDAGADGSTDSGKARGEPLDE